MYILFLLPKIFDFIYPIQNSTASTPLFWQIIFLSGKKKKKKKKKKPLNVI
jgi:hypothetical protein